MSIAIFTENHEHGLLKSATDFEIPTTAGKETDYLIARETRKYNSQFMSNDFAPLSVYCRDDARNIVDGLTGKTYWNYLDTVSLWVEKQKRKTGIPGIRTAGRILRKV